MQIDTTFMKSILTLYDELLTNGVSLVYLGEFNHEITKMFTSMSEEEMERQSEDRSVQRKVYHSMVETLQNMNKHSDEISDEGEAGKGLFMIGKSEEIYYILTSNKVSKDKILPLKTAIEKVNSATPQELKAMHKAQLRGGKLSQKQGAGLGLIDIVRKTEEKLDYQFLPLDENYYFFMLKVEIDSRKF
jgi:hypothetical protein